MFVAANNHVKTGSDNHSRRSEGYARTSILWFGGCYENLLGIAYQTFRTKRVGEDKPFENEFVVIRKGMLNTILHESDMPIIQ